ncbi:hypothetical protein A2856_00300 [Candidatus Uhrbacteria bacterium RIFCSPHIGHO2_01_FULL_63_20]|uniref:Uncharacterized protein n=1 Tax=Candidatus Uhrbacteria bacterium RIFCSPHIGHO2_01_FULL_63_20 TaxID=1802385 RepID=A0A1F7TLS6_9BACT|nr:MAG: hypothetical protein A2856_00300 [Candidatus Uhrbacteria bacterium RIFCSPHIGHO2_01_FULL_63_20]
MPGAATLAERIIQEQELVIGPMAWREAQKVSGLKVSGKSVSISGPAKAALAGLVSRYEGLFGPASVEVCRDAVKTLLPDVEETDVPEILR